MKTEAALKRAIAASGSFAEQRRLIEELDAVQRGRTARLADERSLDMADRIVNRTMTPVLAHTLHTGATDWLDEVADFVPANLHQASTAEAAMWYRAVPEFVKADRRELTVQAAGKARQFAGQFGIHATASATAFLDYVDFLNRREGASGLDQIQQTVAPDGESYSSTDLPQDVFDTFEDPIAPENQGVDEAQSSDNAPLMQEIQSETGSGQGAPERPITHDDSPEAVSGISNPDLGTTSMAIGYVTNLGEFQASRAASRGSRRVVSEVVAGQMPEWLKDKGETGKHDGHDDDDVDDDGAPGWLQDKIESESRKTSAMTCSHCGSSNVTQTIKPGYGGSGPRGSWRMGDPGGREVLECKNCGKETDRSKTGSRREAEYTVRREPGTGPQRPCGMEWHYGTVGPINHSDPSNTETGWHGIHGEMTSNPSGLCTNCENDWKSNYPGHALPRPISLKELSRKSSRTAASGNGYSTVEVGDRATSVRYNGDKIGHVDKSDGGYLSHAYTGMTGGVPVSSRHDTKQQAIDKIVNTHKGRTASRTAASGLEQVQQTTDVNDQPAPTPMPTDVAFPVISLPEQQTTDSQGGEMHDQPPTDAMDDIDKKQSRRTTAQRLRMSAATQRSSDFRKGYHYASRWQAGDRMVNLGSAQFEAGLLAGLVDNPSGMAAFVATSKNHGRKHPGLARRIEVHATFMQRLAETSTDLDTMAPSSYADPDGSTPLNGPGTAPELNGGNAAAPGGPAPYNGEAPYGSPVTDNPLWENPQGLGGEPDDSPIPSVADGADGKTMAFRRRVQAGLLATNQGR